ncbi:DUF7057 domain-containing protein [Providencia stuartii]|uniref:DUF7057 domain-containing protein n=1 Tax=Providencia TaxID=586 RepID=UPI00234B24D7|nr:MULTISPECIES: DUF4153 domain-containing protein [Providencia]MDE8745533.1 DUF4153 domain-containing protein [Providencia thailandensis]MDE8764208.1 DUF4153 domain-containing protein [Providencia thailandensis]MDE8776739.1 DUF4153 domain-containing protein [Providencia thailandensis]MDE8780728.1 DUF4153 domain-containing protein [Providencia thailandensis]MDE8784696.1 DUF4153 domain-containing protein [Providencia thailandensis]
MGQQIQREAISRYAYLFVALLAIIQSTLIVLSTDSSFSFIYNLSAPYTYLPFMVAIFVPSAVSYLITNAKSAIFYTNILIIAVLTVWITLWDAKNLELSYSQPQFTAFATLIVLFFFLLPWLQTRQLVGRWHIDYSHLLDFYIKNTLLMIIATVIGGLLVILLYLASFLFTIVNLSTLSQLIDNNFTLYSGFTLGFNIGLVFLRSIFEFRFSQFIHYIARFFLIILHLIAAIFVGGFLFSFVMKLSILEVGASAILWFLALNIILINLTYGNGHHQYQRFTWLNTLTLSSIILLNFFSLFSLYGILVRVNQYSWSVSRLYAFSIALFFTVIIFAYSFAIIRRRTLWAKSLGTINKVGIVGLMAAILMINSPIADFNRITANSILASIENGKIDVNPRLAFALKELGPKGQQAIEKLKLNPNYTALLYTDIDIGNEKMSKSPKEAIIIAKNSAELPESWWSQTRESSCINNYHPPHCLGFMADINQDGQNEVIICRASPKSDSLACTIWQYQITDWKLIDHQISHYDSVAQRDNAWDKLLNGQFKLVPKEWLQVVPEQ